MPFYPSAVYPLSPQQANPFGYGMQQGTDIAHNLISNAFQPSTLQAQLQSMQLANQAQQIRNQYLPQAQQANIGLTQAQANAQNALPGLYGAEGQEAIGRGNYFGAQGNLIRQQTPALVQQAEVGVYKDPILSRFAQLEQAIKTGQISPNILRSGGMLPPGMSGQSGIPSNGSVQGIGQQLQNAGITQNADGTLSVPGSAYAGAVAPVPNASNTQSVSPYLAMAIRQRLSGGQMGGPNIPGMTPDLAAAMSQQANIMNGAQSQVNQRPQLPVGRTGFQNSQVFSNQQNSGGAVLPPGAIAPNVPTGTTGFQNWAITGTPYGPLYSAQLEGLQKGYEEQAAGGVNTYNEAQQKALKTAQSSNDIIQAANQFQNSYNKLSAIEQGPLGGKLSPYYSDTAQAVKQASVSMTTAVAKEATEGRVTNYDFQFVGSGKPNLEMYPQTANMVANYLRAHGERYQEQPNFLNAARNDGVDPQTAQTLWQQYMNQRPVYNFSQNKPNTNFSGTWKDFLTPQAINAAKSGQIYVPSPQFNSAADVKAWLQTIPPADAKQYISQLPKRRS